MRLACRKKFFDLSEKTLVCGILNVTPDSFSNGGLYFTRDKAIERAMQMQDEGADFLDIGGESTRPGTPGISLEEERRRLIPVLEKLIPELDIPVSVDTCKSQVAREALEIGAEIINDISALRRDIDMGCVVAESGAACILMHMQGEPTTMQQNPRYNDVVSEVRSFLEEAVQRASSSGISHEKIVVDPGIGFGKKTEHNLELLKRLPELGSIGRPILVGVSRKSVIGNVLKLPVEERLEGTAALVACSILNGARIVRVHDVKYMLRVVTMVDAVKKGIKYA